MFNVLGSTRAVNIDPDVGKNALLIACMKGNLEEVTRILELGDKEDFFFVDSSSQNSVYHFACREGHTEVVKALLLDSRIDPSDAGLFGVTPFSVACEAGHTEIVKILMNDIRVDIDRPDAFKATPFYQSCAAGKAEIVELLLQDGRINVNSTIGDGWGALGAAAMGGHERVVELLLADPRFDPIKPDDCGNTPFSVALLSGHANIIRVLLVDERVITPEFTKKTAKLLSTYERDYNADSAVEMSCIICTMAGISPETLFTSEKQQTMKSLVESKLKLYRSKSAY